MSRPPRVFICTGESSGDLHAAALIRALKQQEPGVRVTGLGGDKMAAAGCELTHNLIGLAAMWHKTAGSLFRIVPILLQTDRLLAADPPDVVVILDYPGFNFPLAQRAKSRGIPVLWYIPPQMWAWGKWRLRKLRKRVSRVACIFPFEEAMYREAGVTVRYVGHPLMDALAAELDSGPGPAAFSDAVVRPDAPKIGLLPGSRKQEVETLLPVMLEVARAVAAKFPAAEFTLGRANESLMPIIAGRLAAAGVKVRLHGGRSYDIMRQADLVLVASGTATLECALFAVPMIIMYDIGEALYRFARMFIKSPFIGLANVVAGRKVVPEFAPVLPPTPVISAEALDILSKPERQAAMRAELRATRGKLGEPGASRRAAEEVLSLAAESRARRPEVRRRGSSGILW